MSKESAFRIAVALAITVIALIALQAGNNWIESAPGLVARKAEKMPAIVRFGLEQILERLNWLISLAAAMVGGAAASSVGAHTQTELSVSERSLAFLAVWFLALSIWYGMMASTSIYSALAQSYIPNVFAGAIERPLKLQHYFFVLGTALAGAIVGARLLVARRT